MPIKSIISKRRERDLTKNELTQIQKDFVQNILDPNNMEYGFFFTDREGWLQSLEIVRETNINSSDAIHLATALALDCDILLTSDNHFITEGNTYLRNKVSNNKLEICHPDKFDKIIEKLGFE